MTEAEWLACEDPGVLLRSLRGFVSMRARAAQRRARMLGVAACRRLWHLLEAPALRQGVEAARGYADGRVSAEQLLEASREAERAWHALLVTSSTAVGLVCEAACWVTLLPVTWRQRGAGRWSLWSLVERVLQRAALGASGAVSIELGGVIYLPLSCRRDVNEERAQCDLVRDIFGNPFRPALFDPSWRVWQNGLVGRLAHAIYAEDRWDDLPVLADALEDAGCADAQVLGHCRTGCHVPGCWVIDAVLSKK